MGSEAPESDVDMEYIVEKEKGGLYYVRHIDDPKPIKGSFGDKKFAIKFAARLCGVSTKEYTKLRKSED